MGVHIIIGKGFGDEGKGLAADYFAGQALSDGKSCLIIRHNGGAQAGHTVDRENSRFIFHQLSSGSLQQGAAYWAAPFLPDLYKLPEEVSDFQQAYGFCPPLYANSACRCVCIDDVLLNMALETARGKNRHGSCGMGINEAVERSGLAEFRLTLKDIAALTAEGLYHALRRIRREYVPQRLADLSLTPDCLGEYGALLQNDTVLYNAAETMRQGLSLVTLKDDTILRQYDEVIFEGAQGLLLDACYERYAPHLTSSRTGIGYPLSLAQTYCPTQPIQAVYVTRSYVTRHGRGPLPYEGQFPQERYPIHDLTNQPNPWQEQLRLSVHGTPEEFLQPVREDIAGRNVPERALVVTHLNETQNYLCTVSGDLPPEQWIPSYCPSDMFDTLYLSDSPFIVRQVSF